VYALIIVYVKRMHDGSAKTAVLKSAEKFRIVLKKEQFESIYQFCLGKTVFVSLPTGYSRSIICTMLPFIFSLI